MDYNLENIVKFFKCDLQVKKLLDDCTPKQEYLYDGESYSNILSKSIDYIEYYIDSMLNLYPVIDSNYSKEFFYTLRLHVDACNNDFYKLKDLYLKKFAWMSEELISAVADRCVGYVFGRGVSLKKANSVNEILHVIHQTVVNNENIYKKLPQTCSKKNFENYNITLYGENNSLATRIYNAFPFELSSGDVDIISFNNQFLIMVRDRGHALTMEISKNIDGTYFINYFIPKICNVDMVNRLRGVTKVDNNSRYTKGMFRNTEEELPFALIDFIEKVPMDEDMFIEGGIYYNSSLGKNIK